MGESAYAWDKGFESVGTRGSMDRTARIEYKYSKCFEDDIYLDDKSWPSCRGILFAIAASILAFMQTFSECFSTLHRDELDVEY